MHKLCGGAVALASAKEARTLTAAHMCALGCSLGHIQSQATDGTDMQLPCPPQTLRTVLSPWRRASLHSRA